MSVKGIHWAQEMRGVCPFKKALLYALGERHNKDTGLCCPDQVMLAQDAGMSERTVRKYLVLLEQDGLIERRVVSTSSGRETRYILKFDRRIPQNMGGVRQVVPKPKRQDLPDPVRKDLPDVGSGEQLPDGSGACVPLQKNTNLHEQPHTPSGDELAFEEIWASFRKLHTTNRNQSRMSGKAKTLKLFLRKAQGGLADTIRTAALAEVARQKTNQGGKFLKGLTPWLNAEPWDTGEDAPAAATVAEWDDRLWFWREQQRWQSDWGPAPNQPGYRGPKVSAAREGLFA